MSLTNEISLVKALKEDNVKAFDHLFNLYCNRIYYFAYRYLKSKENAEEVVQEVFFQVWKRRKKLDPKLSFKSYLFTIAYHLILEYFEKISREQNYKEKIIDETVMLDPGNDERLNYRLLLERVRKVIEKLPKRQKEVLLMRRKDELPVKKIAEKLNISPKTVENHFTQALKTIKKQLGADNVSEILLFFFFIRPSTEKILRFNCSKFGF